MAYNSEAATRSALGMWAVEFATRPINQRCTDGMGATISSVAKIGITSRSLCKVRVPMQSVGPRVHFLDFDRGIPTI